MQESAANAKIRIVLERIFNAKHFNSESNLFNKQMANYRETSYKECL